MIGASFLQPESGSLHLDQYRKPFRTHGDTVVALEQLRANAQKYQAKGGRCRKINLPSFLVYKELLTSLLRFQSYFLKMWLRLGNF